MPNSNDIQYLMQEAMMLERACSRLKRMSEKLSSQRREEEIQARNLGLKEPVDESYTVTQKELSEARKKLARKSDKLWRAAERMADTPDSCAEELARAVVMNAVSEYARALCTRDDRARLELMEFFRGDAREYTNVDMARIAEQIREAYPAFRATAINHRREIEAESENPNGRHAYTCPLDGGAMYATKGKRTRINCSRCSLFHIFYTEAEE